MALSRRTGARFQASIWPGFVDAMTGLLLVLMFVLTIFMVMQFVLQETIKGQGMQLDELNLDIVQKNDQLQDLAGQISALGNALGLERATAANLRDQVAGLDSSLAAAKADGRSQLALISTLTGQRDARIAELNSANSRINDFETKVASLLVLQQQAEGDIDAFKLQVSQLQNAKAEAEVEISDFENQVVSLLQQQDTLDGQITEFEAQLTLLVAQAMEDTTSIATVESQVTELEAQNATASATIGDFEARVRQMLAEQARDRANIAELGSERASLQQSLLAAKATITAQVERAALAEKQRALMDEMLDDMRRDTQATGANLSNTLALLASQQQRAVALEQANQALQERAKGLNESLEEGQLKINELLEEGQLEIAAAAILRERLFDAETALTQQELERFSMAAATEKLRKDLENSEAALSSLALQLNDQRKEAERTLTLLAAAQTAGSGLNEKLATALLTLEAAKAAETLSQEQLAALQKQDAATTQELQEALLRLKNREIKLAQLQTDLEMAQGSLRAKAAELQSTQSRLEEVLPLREALARAISEQTTLEEKLTDAEKEAALLATAQGELSKAEAISTEAQRQMALLSAEVGELRAQIGGLQSILDDARRRDEDNKVKITNLGSDLNMALAQAASEARKNLVLETVEKQRLAEEAARLAIEAKSLGKYKSEFFGRMRGLLEGIEGVQIVGDRFVFSSEVLFPSGGADLSDGGQRDIAEVSKILQNIADQMPSGIDWILQVDGHTDDQAVLPGSEWGSNWELSQARALSIVLFLANEQGMEPSRLSANGFGEFQPLNPEDTPAARAQNRRIELKLTER